MEAETTTLWEFTNEGKAIVEKILGSEDKNNPKEQACESHSQGPSRKVNHMSKVIWDKKNYNKVHQVYQFHQNRLANPLWWTLKSLKTETLADVLIERTSSMLDKIESKTVHKDEKGEW